MGRLCPARVCDTGVHVRFRAGSSLTALASDQAAPCPPGRTPSFDFAQSGVLGCTWGNPTRNPCCTTGRWSVTLPGASVLRRNTPGPERWQRYLHQLPSPFHCSQDPRTSLPQPRLGEARARGWGARGRDSLEGGRRRRRRLSHGAPPLSGYSQLPCALGSGPAPGSPPAGYRACNN